MSEEKWTLEGLETHIKTNVADYGSAVVVAMLFHKLYGRLPKMGLSGFQAEGALATSKVLPEPKIMKEKVI